MQTTNTKIATNEEIIKAYKDTGSVWKAAELLNMCGQSVWERLKKLKKIKSVNIFTEEEDAILKEKYLTYRDAGKVDDLARLLNRTKPFICRQAKRLGLTDNKHKKVYVKKWKYMEEKEASVYWEKFKKVKKGLNEYCRSHKIPKSGFTLAMKKHFLDEWEHVIELKTKKQSFYRLGRHVEYSVRDAFKKEGYVAMRSPASKGPCDLVAIAKNIVVFIQCKRGMNLGVAEWNIFYDLSLSVNAVPILAGRPTGRGLVYCLLTGKKDGSKKRQPMREIKIEDIKQWRFSERHILA